MALRNITNYKTDDILRKKSKYINKIDKRTLQLINDMADTMYKEDGVGLAAPQVGILKRIIVVDIGDGIIKLINPKIVEGEGEQQDVEGCLSVPGIGGEVIRPYRVKVKGINEIDHLDGILFMDKVVPGTIKNINI